jgi:hypothetical protein
MSINSGYAIRNLIDAVGSTRFSLPWRSIVMNLGLREEGGPETSPMAPIPLSRCPDYGCRLQREPPSSAVLISITTATPRLSSYHSHYCALPPQPPPLSPSRYSSPLRRRPPLPAPRSAYFVSLDPSSSRPASSSLLDRLAGGRKKFEPPAVFVTP